MIVTISFWCNGVDPVGRMLIPLVLIKTKLTPRLLKSTSLTNLLFNFEFFIAVVPITKSSPISCKLSEYLKKNYLQLLKQYVFLFHIQGLQLIQPQFGAKLLRVVG